MISTLLFSGTTEQRRKRVSGIRYNQDARRVDGVPLRVLGGFTGKLDLCKGKSINRLAYMVLTQT